MADYRLVLYGTDDDGEGEITIELDTGDVIEGPCKFLTLKVLNVADGAKETVDLIVPASAGPALLAVLLTPEQLEAASYV